MNGAFVLMVSHRLIAVVARVLRPRHFPLFGLVWVVLPLLSWGPQVFDIPSILLESVDCPLDCLDFLELLHDPAFYLHLLVNGAPEVQLAVKFGVFELGKSLFLHCDFGLFDALLASIVDYDQHDKKRTFDVSIPLHRPCSCNGWFISGPQWELHNNCHRLPGKLNVESLYFNWFRIIVWFLW